MEEVLVSIDCITYNHEKYISDAIESFLMQKTNFKYEILIHDDASTDSTPEIIKEYQRKYPDIIKPILQKENQRSKGKKKISYEFNVSRAKGKYIAICEGDDYWTDPYKLQKQFDYMEKNEKCGMCFHSYKIEVNGNIKNEVRTYNKSCIAPVEDIIIGGGEFVATNSIFYRKEGMNNPPELFFNCIVGDYPLQILTSINTYAYYFEDCMSVYRFLSENSWTSKMMLSKDSDKKIIAIRENVIDMLKDFNIYSKNKYDEIIQVKNLLLEMDILFLKNDFKRLKELKKSNNEIYKKAKKKMDIKLKFKFNLPRLFKFLKNLNFR